MKMEKLQMCRICLAQNTHKHVVVNKNLHDFYEKLTDVPFVTEDKRPILACFLCYAKLKQCFRFKTKCLEAEELFAQMINEPNPLTNPDQFVSSSGLITTPIKVMSIVDNSEGLDDIIEPKKEILSDDLESDVDNSYLDEEDVLPDHSEPDSEGDVPLIEIKIEMDEEIEASENKQTAAVTNSTSVTTKIKQEDAITTELRQNEPSNLQASQTTLNRTYKPGTSFEEPDECDQSSLYEVEEQEQYTETGISVKPYKCKVCQRSFTQKSNLTKHIRTHTGEKPYKCEVCQRSFSASSSLARHIQIVHTDEHPYKCEVCQRSFSVNSSLIRHSRIHTHGHAFKCEVCQRSFSVNSDLIRHSRTHTDEKPYKCTECPRSFNEKFYLTRHFRIHTREKPYKCYICQRSFCVNNSLSRHIRTHTGEKPFKCNVCRRTFSAKVTLIEHTRTHTGEKPYVCDTCQRSFSQKSSLTKHIRTHTGVKPYKCHICQSSFSVKSALTRHIRIHTEVSNVVEVR